MPCPRCGFTEIFPQDRFCPACGTLLWKVEPRLVGNVVQVNSLGVPATIPLVIENRFGETIVVGGQLVGGGAPVPLVFDDTQGFLSPADGAPPIGVGIPVYLEIQVLRQRADHDPPVPVTVTVPGLVTAAAVAVGIQVMEDDLNVVPIPADVWHRDDGGAPTAVCTWDPGVRCLTSWQITVAPDRATVDFDHAEVNGAPVFQEILSLPPDGTGLRAVEHGARLWVLHDVTPGANNLTLHYTAPTGPGTVTVPFTVNAPPPPPGGIGFYLAIDLGNSGSTVAVREVGGAGNLTLPLDRWPVLNPEAKPWMWSVVERIPHRWRDPEGGFIPVALSVPHPPRFVGDADQTMPSQLTDPKKQLLRAFMADGQIPDDLQAFLEILVMETLRRGLQQYWKDGGFQLSGNLQGLAITVPTIWPPALTRAIQEAAEHALALFGLEGIPVYLMPEGMAPLYAVPLPADNGPAYYVVWDFGSSTTDISLFQAGIVNPIGWAGANLGGRDVDQEFQKRWAAVSAAAAGASLDAIRSLKELYDPQNLGAMAGVLATIVGEPQVHTATNQIHGAVMPGIEAWLRAKIGALIQSLLDTAQRVSGKLLGGAVWNLLVTGNASLLKLPGAGDFRTLLLQELQQALSQRLGQRVPVALLELPDGTTPKSITVAGMAAYVANFGNIGNPLSSGISPWTVVHLTAAPGARPEVLVWKGDPLPQQVVTVATGSFFLVVDDSWDGTATTLLKDSNYGYPILQAAPPGTYRIVLDEGGGIQVMPDHGGPDLAGQGGQVGGGPGQGGQG